jgi:hypothetical protein
MKSPMPATSPFRDAVDPEGLWARVQLRDEQGVDDCVGWFPFHYNKQKKKKKNSKGTMGEELRACIANGVLTEVPLDDTTVSVRVVFVVEGSASWPNLVVHWHRRPVAVFLVACGDVEEFKEKHMKGAMKWIEDAETRQLEWIVAVSEGAQRGRGCFVLFCFVLFDCVFVCILCIVLIVCIVLLV